MFSELHGSKNGTFLGRTLSHSPIELEALLSTDQRQPVRFLLSEPTIPDCQFVRHGPSW
jgi:hypothetical protein